MYVRNNIKLPLQKFKNSDVENYWLIKQLDRYDTL
jgi:hypothetical protein